MKRYEVAVLLHPDLEIDLEAPLARVEKAIKDAGGSIVSRDDWGKRKLAYPINKLQHALYFFWCIEFEPAAITELNNALKLNDEVIRHLVTQYQEPPVRKDDDTKDSNNEEE